VFEVVPGAPNAVDPALRNGWLCFDHARERRRLTPIPKNWRRLSEQDISRMWARAQPVASIWRLIGSSL
jgi:hypothetical protein